MDRFHIIKEHLVQLAQSDGSIKAVIVIGSQARSYEKADDYSDLDVILVCTEPDKYLYDDAELDSIGRIMISFTEPTIGGAVERRLLFEGGFDVDLIVLSADQFSRMTEQHLADGILSRGFDVLYDENNICSGLTPAAETVPAPSPADEAAFLNAVNDFWFHTVWTAKKIKRGELWTAIMCLDSYLKHKLLSMIELSEKCRHGHSYDTWHNGRMLEKWVSEKTAAALENCFARYDREDIISALKCTADLYSELAAFCADAQGYVYPRRAEEYARSIYQALLDI